MVEEKTRKELMRREPGINSRADILRGPGRPRKPNSPKNGNSKLEKVRKSGLMITHGVTAKNLLPWIIEAEKRLFKKIYEENPHLQKTDSFMVQMLARNMRKMQQFDEYFERQGMLDEDGKLRDAYRVYWTCQKTSAQICKAIGMTTEAKVKLGLKVGELRQASNRLLADEEYEADS